MLLTKGSFVFFWAVNALLIYSSCAALASSPGFIDEDDNVLPIHHVPLAELKWQKVKLCSGWAFSYPISMLPSYIPHYGTNGREYHSSNNKTVLRIEQNASHLEISQYSISEYKRTLECKYLPPGLFNASDHLDSCVGSAGHVQITYGNCTSVYAHGPLTEAAHRAPIQIELCGPINEKKKLFDVDREIGITLHFLHTSDKEGARCQDD